ncbi:MAG: hypothetical protein ACRD88_10365 [Terriglobia bacterium]
MSGELRRLLRSGRDVFRISAFFLIVDWVLLLLIVPLYWPLIGIG